MKKTWVNIQDVLFFQEGPGVRNTQYATEGVKLLNVANLVDGKVDLSTSDRYISEEEAYGKYKHFLCNEGDFVIASSGIKVEYIDKKMGFIDKSMLPLCMNTSTIRFRVLDENQLRKVEITVAPKGFGSENMSRVCMLKPADGIDGVKNAVIDTVKLAGPNACPPVVVGVGIGGTFEKCALLAKKALTRDINSESRIEYVAELEKELLDEINNLNIGPGGLGGKITALGVNIETYPTHIAGLPVAINMCCHVNRHKKRIL